MASSILSQASPFVFQKSQFGTLNDIEATFQSRPELFRTQAPKLSVSVRSSIEIKGSNDDMNGAINRRSLLCASGVALIPLLYSPNAQAETSPKLCDAACEKILESAELITTESGLQYKDIIVGTGGSPPVGFQVAANYVAMVADGKIFDSSLEKGIPYIFRVGSGQVIPGLDEGILTMKVGGLRRLYIPGPLAFPKVLPSAPGRPRVPANSPVMFDVSLVYVPGIDEEEE